MSVLINIAAREIGTTEILGPDHNPRIVNYAKEAGFKGIIDDETPWCSIFMNWLAKKAFLESSGKANARSWLHVGIPVSNPEPGDVVIFWRDNPNSHKGHVGIFMGFSQDKTRVYTLGGNQGDMVSQSAFLASKILGFRRLRSVKKVSFANKNLKRGDFGSDVVKLQDALKLLGFNPGTSDGIFGPKTEETLKMYQSSHLRLKVNGKFDRATRNKITKQLDNI